MSKLNKMFKLNLIKFSARSDGTWHEQANLAASKANRVLGLMKTHESSIQHSSGQT